jgi:hypothetical protein
MIQSDMYDTETLTEYQRQLAENGAHLFEIDLFDSSSLLQMILRFSFNLLICWIITHYFYHKKSARKDYYFTFILFGITIFFLLYILKGISMGTGFALGLFCIFGMIRYRTESIQIRDMTYLFVIIGISAVNGLSIGEEGNVNGTALDYTTLIATNALLIGIIWILESVVKQQATKIVLYEKIALIKPDKYNEMLVDLKQRTGLNIEKVEVGHIDFLRDVAFLKVYYKPTSGEINTIDHVTKFS